MNKQVLFLNIVQAIASVNGDGDLITREFDRPLRIHVARNSKDEISYITMEFAGDCSQFMCSILFNGNGHQDTGLQNFSMPKRKLQAFQKSLVLLSCLQFLADNAVLAADMAYFRDRINGECGRPELLEQYELITIKSEVHIRNVGHVKSSPTSESKSQNFSF